MDDDGPRWASYPFQVRAGGRPARPTRIAGLIVALLATSLVLVARPDAAAAGGSCPTYSAGASRGLVDTSGLEEASGLAAGRVNPGVVWAHADSGTAARLYALDRADATLVASFDLTGATNVDWEDLAVGPGPAPEQSYLYVGDIGGNTARQAQTVYRVPEPVIDGAAGPGPHALAGAEALPFTYPDGAHDAESLMVDPSTGDLIIVAKNFGATPVFRYPSPQGPDPVEVEKVTDLNFSVPPLSGWLATGGDISPAGDEILIRTYFSVFAWPRGAGESVADALAGTPCPLPLESEPQGEAIAYAADAKSYFTLSEWGDGPQPLLQYGCGHGFSDVPAWVDSAVDWIACQGHATGYADMTFGPDRPISRAQTARMLHRVAGSPDPGVGAPGCTALIDVPVWAGEAICWLVNNGFAAGYADMTFGPDRPISRAEITRMLHLIHV